MKAETRSNQVLAGSVHYGYVVLALIILTTFGSLGLARHGYTSVLPAMQEGLKLTNTQTGELQSWNLLGYTATVVFAGLLAARFGARVVISISLLVTGTALILTGAIPTFEGARLGRCLAGVGGAGGNIPAMALVAAWFGVGRRGRAAGAAVAGSSLGLIVTGPLVPALVNRFGAEGWRIAWYVLGALAFAVFLLCALLLRDRPEPYRLAPIGESEAEAEAIAVGRGGGNPSASQAWSTIYRSGQLWHLALVYFAFGFSYVIYSTFFIRHLAADGGFTKGEAGLLWLKVGVVSVISGFLWGSVADRWGRRLALVSVFGLQGLAFLVFGLSRALPLVYVSAALFALTAWSIPALMAALSGDLFGGRLAPAALGLMTIVFGVGQTLGPYLAGRIADATHSFSLAFVTAGAVALIVGGGGSLLLPRR